MRVWSMRFPAANWNQSRLQFNKHFLSDVLVRENSGCALAYDLTAEY